MRVRLAIIAAVGMLALASGAAEAQQVSTLCQFRTGPKAGAMQSLGNMPAAPVGTACHDGMGSVGVLVPMGGMGMGPPAGPPGMQPHAPGLGAPMGMAARCQFTTGPRAGQSIPYPRGAPPPIGTSCHDGAGSSGIVVTN